MNQRIRKIGQKGQGSVEYILMILTISVIVWSVMGKLQDYFTGNAENCNASSTSFICMVKKAFTPDGAQPFKYYTLR